MSLEELATAADGIGHAISQLELALKNYPLAQQSVAAYRTHVGEQRDFLKWIAAFASAGLFVALSVLRDTEVRDVESMRGLVISEIAFLLCVVSAGMYWWRVDLPMGRYLESFQHRVGVETVSLTAIILAHQDLERSVTSGNVTMAREHFRRGQAETATSQGRGELPRPRLYETEPVSLFWKYMCVGGYGIGILTLVIDQLLRLSP